MAVNASGMREGWSTNPCPALHAEHAAVTQPPVAYVVRKMSCASSPPAPAHAHDVPHGWHGQRVGQGLVERGAAARRQRATRQQGALEPEQREAVLLIHCGRREPMLQDVGTNFQAGQGRRCPFSTL